MGEHFWPNTPSPTSSSFMAAFLIYKYVCSLYLSNRYLKLDRACTASTLSCPLCIYRYVFIFLWLQNINLTPPICLSISPSFSSSSISSCSPAVFPMAARSQKAPRFRTECPAGLQILSPKKQLNLRPQGIAALMMRTKKKEKTSRSERCPSDGADVPGDALKSTSGVIKPAGLLLSFCSWPFCTTTARLAACSLEMMTTYSQHGNTKVTNVPVKKAPHDAKNACMPAG